MSNYIPPKIVEEINDKAKLVEVANEIFTDWKRSGVSIVRDCPNCGGKKKLTVTASKGIWKCFKCDLGGGDGVSFVREYTGYKTFPEACQYLAKIYKIHIPETVKEKEPKTPFRDLQLLASGIQEHTQKYTDDKGKEQDRYITDSHDKYGKIVDGRDMIIHYWGLYF